MPRPPCSLIILTSRLRELEQLLNEKNNSGLVALVEASTARRAFVGLFNCCQSMPNTVMLALLPRTPTDSRNQRHDI